MLSFSFLGLPRGGEMACSFSRSYRSGNSMKENQNMCLVRPWSVWSQSTLRPKNMKIRSSQSGWVWRSVMHSYEKRYCNPNYLFSIHFFCKKYYFCKASVVGEGTTVGKISGDVSNTKDENTIESNNVEKETLNSLEWQAVCNQVSEFASTSMGFMVAKEGCLPVGSNLHESEELLDQTAAALLLPDAVDFSGIQDIRKIVASAVSGNMCTVHEFCSVRKTLHSARSISDRLYNFASEFKTSLDGEIVPQNTKALYPLLKIMDGADFCTDLANELGHCLECTFLSVLDRASPDLAFIRSSRRSNMDAIETLLKETAARVAEAGGMDRPLITKRRSRLCVGVRATHKSLLPGGIVLDVSSSGATYFMEPKDVLNLNNMEVQLAAAERTEELTILGRLTSTIAGAAANITNILERVMAIDFACARARYASFLGAVCPIFSQKEGNIASSCKGKTEKIEISEMGSSFVDIEGIQHPLLLESALQKPSSLLSSTRLHSSIQKQDASFKKAETLDNFDKKKVKFPVPIDIKIGPGKKVVVISGPNTGGKTATMKTLGLAAIMAKAGLFLPAKGQPRLPWFDHVMADIGDNQSLEQSLSTYSGHIRRLCKILEVGTKQSLVLIDEIGSGTDPSEGVALSASILQHLAGLVSLTVVTTHYADLSCLKDKDNRFENAAMEFDIKTLHPTFRILWATTGQSNALDIAQSLGFDPNVLNRAREWVTELLPDRQKERKGGLFQSLSNQKDELQNQARTVATILCEATALYNELLAETEDLDKREAALKSKEEEAVKREVNEVKDRMDKVIANFEKQLHGGDSDFSGEFMKEAQAAITSIIQEYCPNVMEASHAQTNSPHIGIPEIGDQVLIKHLGSKLATVAEAPSKEDGSLLVQLGKLKFRVKISEIEKIVSSKEAVTTGLISVRQEKQRDFTNERKIRGTAPLEAEELKFNAAVQTSRNTLDLRGMRVEDAIRETNITIASRRPFSLLFVIHGMGTGAVKEAVLRMLNKHPRVVKFEQESPMNFGCTVVYIK
eukprot:Gb_24817 [translate_table: standard]